MKNNFSPTRTLGSIEAGRCGLCGSCPNMTTVISLEYYKEPTILPASLALTCMYVFHLRSVVRLRPNSLSRHGASLRGHPYIVTGSSLGTDRNRFILLLRYIKHSTDFYYDIANNAGSHANGETLT